MRSPLLAISVMVSSSWLRLSPVSSTALPEVSSTEVHRASTISAAPCRGAVQGLPGLKARLEWPCAGKRNQHTMTDAAGILMTAAAATARSDASAAALR